MVAYAIEAMRPNGCQVTNLPKTLIIQGRGVLRSIDHASRSDMVFQSCISAKKRDVSSPSTHGSWLRTTPKHL